ncbi:hypothetical protein KI688_009184 [Linnemannia hyalina]|uniref:Uncharacterized protein n=1 Tax=Linnemannia hyalina TaxID=64524 RepID=A0A9P7XYJ4_9FUNG|nr:hypothetical protein KI688_009184 [Linnemannia hyalina]
MSKIWRILVHAIRPCRPLRVHQAHQKHQSSPSSRLETLSICIWDLAEYEAELELDKGGNSSPFDTDAELALYLRKIHNLTESHRRLSHDIDFPDSLRWMNLKRLPVSGGLESTATAQEVAIQSQSRKKSNLALQRRLQDSGILVFEIRMGFMRSIRSAPVGITTGGRK